MFSLEVTTPADILHACTEAGIYAALSANPAVVNIWANPTDRQPATSVVCDASLIVWGDSYEYAMPADAVPSAIVARVASTINL